MGAWLTSSDRRFAASTVALTYCNPLLPERIALEREALGADFDESKAEWNLHGEVQAEHPNVRRLLQRSEELIERLRGKLDGATPTAEELQLYEDLVLFVLYYRFRDVFEEVIEAGETTGKTPALAACFSRFETELRRYLFPPHHVLAREEEIALAFALCFQVKRAFHYIFRNIIGVSGPAARFRAAAWQSIFTHDLRRFRAVLYDKLADITTLVTGPSGTGKDLAARAIAMARYVPFNAKAGRFESEFHRSYHPINLSALSPTLIESELFGHVRGSFTGAVRDHPGRLEECPAAGTVFLDEIGDLDPAIQVKLLRVLQNRSFRRVGDSDDRHFAGKVVAATNRDLVAEMHAGRFREDLYYRLCADVIAAPSLRDRLQDRPEELEHLVLFISGRLAGPIAEPLAEEVTECIRREVGLDYAWPGNVRELEQCVRNVLVRGRYVPPRPATVSVHQALGRDVAAGLLTVDDLLRQYCTLVYALSGSYEEAARRLNVDRRTVKARVDEQLLGRIRGLQVPV